MIVALALSALALAVLALACTMPIYSDEIVWKIIHARYFLDHGLATNAFPQCGPSFLVPTPLTHVPAAALDALLYQDLSSPLKLRIIALAGSLLLLAFYGLMIDLVAQPRWTTKLVLLLGFWGIGATPLLLAMNRPELPLLLGLVGLTYATVRLADRDDGVVARLALFSAIVVLLLATHPKMLFFVPLFAVAGARLLRRPAARLIALALIALVVYQTQQFAGARGACPDSAWTAERLDAVMLKPGLLRQDPFAFARQARANVFAVGEYARGLTLAHSHLAEWVAAVPPLPYIDPAGNALVYLAVAVLALWIVWLSALAVRDFLLTRHLPARQALALAAAVSTAALIGFQSVKNSYDGAFVLGVGALTLALGFRVECSRRTARVRVAALALLAVTAVTSEVRILYHFGGLATGPWLSAGDFPDHGEGWISGFGYGAVRARIRAFARTCGIDDDASLVVVDDLTYPALDRATYPIHTMGLTWWGHGIPDPYAFLQTLGSGGMLVRCRSVREELQARARRDGALCCLPAFGGGDAAQSP